MAIKERGNGADIIGLAARRRSRKPDCSSIHSTDRDRLLAAMGVFLNEHADEHPINPTVRVLRGSTNIVRLPMLRS